MPFNLISFFSISLFLPVQFYFCPSLFECNAMLLVPTKVIICCCNTLYHAQLESGDDMMMRCCWLLSVPILYSHMAGVSRPLTLNTGLWLLEYQLKSSLLWLLSWLYYYWQVCIWENIMISYTNIIWKIFPFPSSSESSPLAQNVSWFADKKQCPWDWQDWMTSDSTLHQLTSFFLLCLTTFLPCYINWKHLKFIIL